MSERKTENLVRDELRRLGYFNIDNGVSIEEQKSEIAAIKSLLSKASKNKKGNAGYPEFLITWIKDTSFVIVIECKADARKHESQDRNQPKDFAVDGAIHYAKHLAQKFNVIAVAASGTEPAELRITNLLFPIGVTEGRQLCNEAGLPVTRLLPFSDYYRLSAYDPDVERKRHSDLLAFSRELHTFIWAKAKVAEEDKPLLVSGTLIALMNDTFRKTFSQISPEDLQDAWFTAITKQLNAAKIPQGKKDTMIQPYSQIQAHPNLSKPDSKTAKEYPQGVFKEIVNSIHDHVYPFINVYHDFDVVGQFYGEFLKYAGGDKKTLGIVLTPKHIAELFALITDVGPKNKALDICTGTGGFLIAAMQRMLKQAHTEEARKDIKENRLIGIENSPKMFSLAASNMILRGDGKANLHQSSCFDDAVVKAVRELKPDVGLLNPPYSQAKSDSGLHELYFVKQMLDCLVVGGIGVAIVPVSCATMPSPLKSLLMEHHTLEAVMSMPTELFYPVGTVTCIMVWRAGIPHTETNKKTWFGYWRDDGFVKTKQNGRCDLHGLWPEIRDRWVESFRNKEVIQGESLTQYVTAEDEWVAEAFMTADYSRITPELFEQDVKRFLLYRLMAEIVSEPGESDQEADHAID